MTFDPDGFLFIANVLDEDVRVDAVAAQDDVRMGVYATGRPPVWRVWNPGDDPSRLCKVDQAHWCDERLMRAATSPAIGRVAAGITGAAMVQVWAVQSIYKPPSPEGGGIGWHQDDTYWHEWWSPGDVFTMWIALDGVAAASGPMRFVRGSHRWGFIEGGNFYDSDLDRIRERLELPAAAVWEEVPAIMGAGDATVHHRRTIHGSGPNTSAAPRRSLAIHMRTECARPLPTAPAWVHRIDDLELSPVVYERG